MILITINKTNKYINYLVIKKLSLNIDKTVSIAILIKRVPIVGTNKLNYNSLLSDVHFIYFNIVKK